MRTRFHRQFVAAGLAAAKGRGLRIPPELGAHQFLLMLLYVAAELEHSLMVQYLYAGYSLGDHLLRQDARETAVVWRETLFGIAKEEMGHLMTVQNLLRCLGGPLNFDRDDYPWDPGFHPFPFELRPLSRESLARYIVAESPDRWQDEAAGEIRDRASRNGTPIHRVSLLYDLIRRLLEDERLVPDALFRGTTLRHQATSDEWARGYAPGQAAPGADQKPPAPQLLIQRVTSRTDAINAVKAVMDQGEAAARSDGNEPSHFRRFLDIYKGWESDPQERLLATNPVVAFKSGLHVEGAIPGTTMITEPCAKLWASLFNVRYRLLLTCLSHTFEYPNNLDQSSQDTPRGLLVNSTFGEMYNLRAIARIVTTYPVTGAEGALQAGPPFQMPFTLKTPVDAADRWRVHVDLLEASAKLARRLLGTDLSDDREGTYLQGLEQFDRRTIALIEGMLSARSHQVML